MELITALNRFRQADRVEEWLNCAIEMYKDGDYQYLVDFRKAIKPRVKENPDFMDFLKRSYDASAKEKFRDFCIATEWNRDDKFFLPRQKGLMPIVNQLQRLADDELDLLCVSMPPGVGKTATAIYFLCWLVGRNSKDGILCGSHNASFLRGMYEECVRELKPGDYRWGEIFKGHMLEKTNALDMKIDVDMIQRFSSLQFGSIGSGLAGKLRAVQLLYCDDLVEGIEEALSKDRLEKKWQQYCTDYRQRKQGNCKELHIATRWSVRDVIGMLKEEYEGSPRAEFLTMSALDENGKSNFDYGGSCGFTTEFYEDIKATMDDISWKALYMNEPVEREGLLYPEESLRRFYDVPEGEPDAILGVCDTAEGGGDSTVLPIFAVYGNDHYLVDVVCSDALPEVTDSLCANALVKNKVQKCQFESNSAGGRTADKVQELVKTMDGRCSITKKRTTANKETKIIVNSDWVKAHCLFLDEKKIEKGGMYYRFMQQVMSYTMMGKNKHDDTVDALAQYALFTASLLSNVIRIADRPF